MSKLPKDRLKAMFPRASEEFIKANAEPEGATPLPADETPRIRRGRGPNKTEREFGMFLEAEKRQGRILRYEFEGIRLKWGVHEKTGEAMFYKPDWFVVVARSGTVLFTFRCIECKGAHIWDRDVVRYKGARAEWPEFEFQFWQKKEG